MRNVHSPRRSALTITVVALVAVVLSGCLPDSSADNLTAVNQARANVAVPELVRVGELDVKAKAQADLIAASGTIFHSADLTAGVSPGWSTIGENVAAAGSVASAQAALEASPPHYQNLTNPGFNQVGIGVTERDGVFYVVQVFVGR